MVAAAQNDSSNSVVLAERELTGAILKSFDGVAPHLSEKYGLSRWLLIAIAAQSWEACAATATATIFRASNEERDALADKLRLAVGDWIEELTTRRSGDGPKVDPPC